MGGNVHELASYEMPATTEEMSQMDEDEANDEPLSQAIEIVTKAGRACKATQKALESAEQDMSLKTAPKSDQGCRGGRRGGRKV